MRVVGALGLVVCTLAVAATLAASRPSAVRFWDNVHWTVSYATATAVAWLGARRATGPTRSARRLFTLGLAALTGGQLLWDAQVASGWNPFPGPSDALFVLVAPLNLAAVLSFARGQPPWRRAAVALDGAGITVVVLALVLAAYLPRRGALDALTMSVLVAYPTAAFSAAIMLLLVAVELREPPTLRLGLLLGGLVAQGLLWAEWNLRTLDGTLGDGVALNFVFSYAGLALGAGIVAFRPAARRVGTKGARAYAAVSRLVPLALVVGASLALALGHELPEATHRAVTVCMGLAVVIAAARQSLVLEERDRLLQAEVRSREVAERLGQSQRLEALGTLASGIAHDLNNMLTAVLGHGSLLASADELPGDARASVDAIVQAGTRAREVVRGVLMFARSEKSPREALDVAALVGEVGTLLRAALPALHVIEVDCPAGLTVHASAGQLHQVLLNLATNASHAIGERGGRVRFGARRAEVREEEPGLPAGRYVEIAVSDDGGGMDEATRARVFEPFFTTKARGRGTGLGLAVVHGIVTDHGGAVRIDSVLGRGTTVRVLLPVAEQAPARPFAPDEAPSARVRVAPSGGAAPAEVLVVDDESVVAETLVRAFGALGQPARFLTSPDEAIALVERDPRRFVLVVTDMVMPQQSGAALARALRAKGFRGPIALSSGTEFALAGSPFDHVLPKPYAVESVRALLERVHEGSGRPPPSAEP